MGRGNCAKRRRVLSFGLQHGAIVLAAVGAARAEPAAESKPTEDATAESPPTEAREIVEAREAFRRGAEFVAKADWSEALAAFERSASLRPHPVTTYNIAICQRALGQYMRARLTFLDALLQDEKGGGALLSETLTTQAKAFIDEIDRMLVRVRVRLAPVGARIAVDGRPLQPSHEGIRNVLLAGLRPPGRGEKAPSARFELLAEPGARVFSLSHPGFGDVVVKRTYAPGTDHDLDLELSRLPAELRIQSDRPGAVVTVSNIDVGVAPVKIERPAGEYDVVVRKPGYVTYETRVLLKPGGQANLRAKLPEIEPALTDRWWFWAAAGAVVTGAAVTTYFVTRPEPERPPPNGGTLGWVVDVR